jgi:hypothetical protein
MSRPFCGLMIGSAFADLDRVNSRVGTNAGAWSSMMNYERCRVGSRSAALVELLRTRREIEVLRERESGLLRLLDAFDALEVADDDVPLEEGGGWLW